MKKQLYLLLTAVLMMGVGTAWATTAYVGTYDELSAAISDASVDVIYVTADIDVPCGTSRNHKETQDLTGAATSQLTINRSLSIQSQLGATYTIRRTAADGATTSNLKSMFGIRGNGTGGGYSNVSSNTIAVELKNIIIDGGANWGTATVAARATNSNVAAYGNAGRSIIDVYYGATLNLEDGLVIQNGYCTNAVESCVNDTYTNPSNKYGAAVRVDYMNATGGGTVNVKAGSTIHDCTAYQGYGGALGAYNFARLNIYGGTIYNCSAKMGGAIACTYRVQNKTKNPTTAGVIKMYGGYIHDCRATDGGAFTTDGQVDDYLLGGTISNCSATNGGVLRMGGDNVNTPSVHIVDHSSGWLTFSDCSNTNQTSTTSTYGYDYIKITNGTISVVDVYQITFINGSETFTVLSVLQGNSLAEAFPASPVKANYRFDGWYDGTNEVTASTVFTGNTTVTAHWTPYVASVNDGSNITYYTEFVTALAAWEDNSTLTLLADVTHNAIIDLTSGTRTIDLNGHGIRHTGTQGIFCVVNGATLTLEDSNPTTTHKFSVDENGFATLDEENGTVTIHGGYLTGGIGSNTYTRTTDYHDGGALFIYNGSTVTMNGGTLIGNGEAASDRTGGAVFIARNGHFIMNGGTITRNQAKYGGGISLYGGQLTADIAEQAPSTLEIHGGEISYNYATGNSGGVHTNAFSCAETVTITGGSIINNHVPIGANAGGMFVAHTNTTVYLSGNPVIKDNLSGTVQRNIQLHSTYVLHINGELTNPEPIGITKSVGAGIFTSGLSGNGDATHFSSDIALYTVALHNNGEAKLCTPASCSAPTAIDGLIYTGVAQALVNAGTANGGTMMYSLDNSAWDAAIPTAKNAGNYTVYFKVIGDATHADYTPADNTVAVTIAKAPLTITASEKWINYGNPLQFLEATYSGFVNGEGPGYIQPAVQFSSDYTQGDNAGTYTITPYGAGAVNYEISYVEGTLHVNKVYAVITATPTAIDGLVANGSAQVLITAGTASGGEMQYSLNNINWSTDLPTATTAGDHTVYYKVVGDINHYSISSASLNVAIAAPSTTIGDPNNAAEVNAFLNYYDGQLVGNLIIDRPVLNNMYNTLCLPFDMDADQIAASSLNGVEIYEFVDATVSNDELYLFTSEEKHEVVAGRPYLVKYRAASQLDDLDFVDVVVNNADLEAQKVVHDGVTFKGTFAPYWMEQQTGLNYEGGYLFLGQNNTLFWPGVSNYVKPFRAYFYVDITTANHNGMPIRRGMPARIGEPHNMPTGVESIQHSVISGQKIMIDGVLYIIRGEHMYDAQGQLVK